LTGNDFYFLTKYVLVIVKPETVIAWHDGAATGCFEAAGGVVGYFRRLLRTAGVCFLSFLFGPVRTGGDI
jgi:hypothetical protein